MTVNELIEKLTEIKERYGDIGVFYIVDADYYPEVEDVYVNTTTDNRSYVVIE